MSNGSASIEEEKAKLESQMSVVDSGSGDGRLADPVLGILESESSSSRSDGTQEPGGEGFSVLEPRDADRDIGGNDYTGENDYTGGAGDTGGGNDSAMLGRMTGIKKQADYGGIDLNQINLNREGKPVVVQFDPVQLSELMEGGFEGFRPVLVSITSIQSPLPLLGVQ